MAFVRFHSKAGGDFFFMPDTQKQVFKVLGRPCTASGAISPEEAKEWIAILENAISREKADDKKREEDRKARAKRVAESFRTQAVHPASLFDEEEKLEEEDRVQRSHIPLGARAYPLLQLLKAAVEENEMVMWGVP